MLANRQTSVYAAAIVALLAASTFASTANAQFSTLDPQQVSTSAGVNLSAVVVDRNDTELDSVGRADIYAEIGFIDFSLYGSLPVMFTLAGSPSKGTIGNLEVGGAHRFSMDGPLSLITHVGLVFPTASSSEKKAEVAFAASTGRVGDLYINSTPELWALRVATSPRADFGAFFMQGDVGFDFLFPKNQADQVGLRTSIGAGVSAANIVTVTTEIANAGLVSKSGTFEQTFSIGVEVNALVFRPRVTYTAGLGDGLGDDYTLTVGAAIGF